MANRYRSANRPLTLRLRSADGALNQNYAMNVRAMHAHYCA